MTELNPELLWGPGAGPWGPPSPPASFRELYQQNLLRHGELPFLACYGLRGLERRATFREFDADVRRAAAALLRTGGELVVTAAGNRYEHIVLLAAALLLGKTACPMNPAEGTARILEKAGALGEEFSLWTDGIEPVPGARSLSWAEELPYEGPWRARAEGRPMVLVFTSGSTGFSKAVEQTEAGVLANVNALAERHGMAPGHCLATPLPVFHVNALEYAFFGCLLTGSRLVLLESMVFPVTVEAIRAEGAQVLSLVPTLLRRLLERAQDFPLSDLSSLKYVVTAAAPLGAPLALSALEKLGVPVLQGYGLSEAVNFSCLMPAGLPREEYLHWLTGQPVPSIGTELTGNTLHVAGEHGAELGEGEAGELCVRGRFVMKGYRGDAERKGLRGSWLRTGDLGYFLRAPNGDKFFFVTGRKKEVLKRDGLTVSLREVDEILSRSGIPGFDAIAVPFAHDHSGEEIAAVAALPADWTEHDEALLAGYLESSLPFHLRPKLVLRTGREIRTASGKPLRWKFTGSFRRFAASGLGPRPRFIEDQDSGSISRA